jgi:hypothetical protein
MGIAARRHRGIGATRGVPRQRGLVRFRRRVPLRHLDLAQRLKIDIERMVTSSKVSIAVIDEWRLDLLTHLGRVSAAWMEAATARWIDRARHVALENDPLALSFDPVRAIANYFFTQMLA